MYLIDKGLCIAPQLKVRHSIVDVYNTRRHNEAWYFQPPMFIKIMHLKHARWLKYVLMNGV